jgi:DNA-binding response OmpR family regulator
MERRLVVVIEDDGMVAAGILRGLRRAGFDVELARDGDSGAKLAIGERVAAVVLDLNLPEKDGFDVLAGVRARSSVPIIVVTARTELSDRLRAFDLGAIDYLPKPFFVEELLARLQARLGPAGAPRRVVQAAGARIDLVGHKVEVGGMPIALTPTEFALLRYLAERPGRAVSRHDLAGALRDLDDADPRNIDAHVSRLRRKLGSASAAIATVWGHGYRFDPEEEST